MLKALPGTFKQSSSHSAGGIETDIREFAFQSQTSCIPRKNNFSRRISPPAPKNNNFVDKLRFTKSKKALQCYLGFVIYYRNYIPRIAEKPNSSYKLLRTEVPINITSELKETFDSVKHALSDACELAVKQPIPGKQLVLMTDASFRSVG